jgi:hypothetical protein
MENTEYASEADYRDARDLAEIKSENKMITLGGLWLTLTVASAFLITDANASTAIVEAASNPDTASMFMESLNAGFADNINQVKEILANSEIANSPMVQETLSGIQGVADTVKETAQVAGENVKVVIDKIKGLIPG